MQAPTKWAFTFVELIIVVVILGILWTIGFVSYSGYLWGVRDGNRIAQIKDIQKTLQVYSTNKSLPLPDDSVEITASGATVGYQWYAGKNVLQQIQYTNGWVDPQDNTYFTYMISKNKKQFQVLTFLEESDNLTKEPTTYLPWITQIYAADLSERYPKSLWAQLWVILQDTTNTPIQDIESGSVDIVTSGDDYHAVLSDTETLSGSGTLFTSLINNASCKRIQQLWKSKGNSTYNINPDWSGDIQVYCDMETDWGGWTSIVRFNPSKNNSSYWQDPKHEGEYYNLLDLKDNFDVHEIYVNKQVWYDGGEYVFEKIGDDLYARRGWLKDTVIRTNWSGLSATLLNWLWFYATVWGYTLIGHTYTTSTYYDFPFYPSWLPGVSDNPWWGRQYDDNIIVNIFIR